MTQSAEFTVLAEWVKEQQQLCENAAKDASESLTQLLVREQHLGASYCLQSLINDFKNSIEFQIKQATEKENAN